MARGKLITIEGIDGAGKSTLAAALAASLGELGAPVELLREPGGVEVAERIRALLVDPDLPVTPRAEALLYAAARAQLVEQLLEPLLSAGTIVLLDRFVDSSLAYQGAGRGLGIASVAQINAFATGGLLPDLTLLLEIEPRTARARMAADGASPDRLEREGEEFFQRIALAYRRLALEDPRRIRPIDGSAAAPLVLQAALAAVADVLPAALAGD